MERRLIAVEGVVQGVGFRPYVHRLAAAGALCGFVRNDVGGVFIDVEGESARVEEFCRRLSSAAPSVATISRVRVQHAEPKSYRDFSIAVSDAGPQDRVGASLPPDVATCDDCLGELFNPMNRRYGHAFISCTACGPRFTITRSTPYDRERTTMAAFPLCGRCQSEYDDPRDRRFHAESIACPACGPTLASRELRTGDSRSHGRAALDAAIASLSSGEVIAIKALGGFHLACDATNEDAVGRLRSRKHRPAKPFAVMVRDAETAMALCYLSAAEHTALASRARPVVLAPWRENSRVVPSVAPGGHMLGVMLPSTALHHLLLRAVDRPLVMTSGNRGGDPVVIDDAAASAELRDIAELLLTNDRSISMRCDDSVVRVVAGEVRPLRRSRGYVPLAIELPFALAAPVLAVGGHLKNTICVAQGRRAHLSAHVGDLESATARGALRSAIEDTLRLVGVRPTVIAHDLHPVYGSTLFAEQYGREEGLVQRVPVQHHHAHVAACVSEFAVRGPLIGVVFDGAGLGTDGAIWGGEFLAVDGARFTRCGHLAYVPLPGGDAAARLPWRSAAAHLARVNLTDQQLAGFRAPDVPQREWLIVQQLLARPAHAPLTSSVGRLFDAVASLLGLCQVSRFEGEAAMALEAAAGNRVEEGYPVTIGDGALWTADPATIIDGVIRDLDRRRARSEIAAAFHGTLRDLVVLGCERIRSDTGLETVVLSGGVFVNALLAASAQEALAARGFRVLLPRQVPCNDGGLSLGQAYVAACALREELCA